MWWVGGAAVAAIVVAVVIGMPAANVESAVPTSTEAVASAPVPVAAAPVPPPSPAPAATDAVAKASVPVAPGTNKVVVSAAVPAPEITAKQLFSNTTGAVSAGLRYRVIQQMPDGSEVDVDTAKTFHSGDKVKLAFESNIAGYLYVASLGSSGTWSVLFPSPDINGGRNTIAPLQEYEVPGDGGAWSFDHNVGTETLFVFLSREPLSQLPGFGRPVRKPETLTASVVTDLQQSIRPRDLIFEKDKSNAGKAGVKQATYVVNRAEVGKAVTTTISLIHQ